MSRLSITIVAAIVRAAEKEGGICNMEMPCRRRKWRRCSRHGMFWYNSRKSHTTKVIKL